MNYEQERLVNTLRSYLEQRECPGWSLDLPSSNLAMRRRDVSRNRFEDESVYDLEITMCL